MPPQDHGLRSCQPTTFLIILFPNIFIVLDFHVSLFYLLSLLPLSLWRAHENIHIYIFSIYSSGILKLDRCYVLLVSYSLNRRRSARPSGYLTVGKNRVNERSMKFKQDEVPWIYFRPLSCLFLIDWRKERSVEQELIFWKINHWNICIHIFLSPRYFLEEWAKTLWIFHQIDIFLKEKVFRSENNSWYKFKPSHDSCSLLFSSLSIIESAKKKKIEINPQESARSRINYRDTELLE